MHAGWRGAVIGYRGLEFRWEVAPLPVGAAGKMALYKGNAMTMAPGSKFPKAAWELAKYMAGPEADRKYVGNGGATPLKANTDILRAEQPPRQNKYFLDPLEKEYARLLPLGPYWEELAQETSKELAAIIMDGKSAREGLESAARVTEGLLKRWTSS